MPHHLFRTYHRMQICANCLGRKTWSCYLGVMIILQHKRRGGVVVGPFHSSTAPLQVALLILQQLKRIDAHILTHNFIRVHTPPLFFCISGQGRSRYSYSLIHMLNNCSNVRNFRERQQHTILLLPFTVDKWSKRTRNYIIKSYLDILWMQSFFSRF